MIIRKKTTEEYADYLERVAENCTLINSGAYAEVFECPKVKGFVVKVFSPLEDEAYDTYLRWCIKHQENPYVPRVHSYVIYDTVKQDNTVKNAIGIVFIEKLKPVKPKQYCDLAKKLSNAGARLNDKGIDSICTLTSKDWAKVSKSKDTHLASFARFMAINTRRKTTNYGNDCHDGNIMMRGAQPVFTDVVCN